MMSIQHVTQILRCVALDKTTQYTTENFDTRAHGQVPVVLLVRYWIRRGGERAEFRILVSFDWFCTQPWAISLTFY